MALMIKCELCGEVSWVAKVASEIHVWGTSCSSFTSSISHVHVPISIFLFQIYSFQGPCSKSWVAKDEDRGVAPSPGFTSLFMSQPAPACFTRGREGVLCSSTQLTTQKFYVRLLCFYKTHFTSSRSIWPIPSFTGHQLHRSLQTGRFSNGTKKFQHTNPLKSCVCSGTPFYRTLVPSDPKW